MGARCVTQRTWRPSAARPASAATTEATRPPMPASTSSNTSVGHAVGASQDRREREHGARQLAARGDAGQRPDLLAGVGATAAARRGRRRAWTDLGRRAPAATSNTARSMPSARSVRSTWPASRPAAARRRSESAVAAAVSSAPSSAEHTLLLGQHLLVALESFEIPRRLVAEARALPPRVSPYLRLRRASASSRSWIASSRPGSATHAVAQAADRAQRLFQLDRVRSRSPRPAARTPDRAGSGPGRPAPRGPAARRPTAAPRRAGPRTRPPRH